MGDVRRPKRHGPFAGATFVRVEGPLAMELTDAELLRRALERAGIPANVPDRYRQLALIYAKADRRLRRRPRRGAPARVSPAYLEILIAKAGVTADDSANRAAHKLHEVDPTVSIEAWRKRIGRFRREIGHNPTGHYGQGTT